MVMPSTGYWICAVLDPEAGRAARVVAGDGVDALPHQLGDQQAARPCRAASRRSRRHWPRPAGCARRRHWRWSAGRACAPSSCPARSAAARRRAPAATRAWPRLRRRTQRSGSRAAGTAARRSRTSPGTAACRRESSRKLARRYSAPPETAPSRWPISERAISAANSTGYSPVAIGRGSQARERRAAAAWRPIVAAASRSSAASADAVPAVALHAVAATGDQRAAEAVLGAALATDEAVRVGVDADALAAADRGAVGVARCAHRTRARACSQASARSIARSASITHGCQASNSRKVARHQLRHRPGRRRRRPRCSGRSRRPARRWRRGCPRAGRRCWRCPCAGRSRR